MTPYFWVSSHPKRGHSWCDLTTAVIAKTDEPPIKRMKRSMSLEASRLALHRDAEHEDGHIDVPCPSQRTENKGRRLSRGHEYTVRICFWYSSPSHHRLLCRFLSIFSIRCTVADLLGSRVNYPTLAIPLCKRIVDLPQSH